MERRTPAYAAATLLACSVALLAAVPAGDPLAAEIARWSAYVRDNRSTDENWTQVKQAVEPVLARASKALQDGQRSLALLRLASARVNLAASQYVQSRPAAERTDIAAFESEWARMGKVLAADRKPVSPGALEKLRPAAVRAIAEAAAPQVKTFYDASLDYARATTAQYGLFYVGNAAAQRDFVAFCRTLSEPRSASAPPVRSLAADLDLLETELLAAYRPPASIDRHSEFIGASATLKEARELDQAGLRYGALLRYLQAAQRLSPLRAASAPPDDDAALAAGVAAFETRLAAAREDPSIGRLFVDAARSDLAEPGGPRTISRAIVSDVFPRYVTALEPAPPAAAKAEPRVTVTLVRWPYT
ncbi:MAG: hypothetical protein M3167_06765 [Acidobacteriota bacterium]|nr:hypothetical protein [Acidobacteriota bacterium]